MDWCSIFFVYALSLTFCAILRKFFIVDVSVSESCSAENQSFSCDALFVVVEVIALEGYHAIAPEPHLWGESCTSLGVTPADVVGEHIVHGLLRLVQFLQANGHQTDTSINTFNQKHLVIALTPLELDLFFILISI